MKINEETTKKLMTEMIQACDKQEEREEKLLEMGITVEIYGGFDAFFDTLFNNQEMGADIWGIILDRSKPVEERVEELIKIYDKQDETLENGDEKNA